MEAAMRTTPLTTGESLPTLELSHADGRAADLDTVIGNDPGVVYFMRTPSCPICHAHLRRIERTELSGVRLADSVVVVVPGDPSDAAAVARRHPTLASRIVSSATAHASVGLFVKTGLQQSGTFVVDAKRNVVAVRTSTIPIGSYDETEVQAALTAARQPA
jgi:peroxiredoxin